MELKLELTIDGTKYGASFDANDDGGALHYDFGGIIYDTIDFHVAAKNQSVLPMIVTQPAPGLITHPPGVR